MARPQRTVDPPELCPLCDLDAFRSYPSSRPPGRSQAAAARTRPADLLPHTPWFLGQSGRGLAQRSSPRRDAHQPSDCAGIRGTAPAGCWEGATALITQPTSVIRCEQTYCPIGPHGAVMSRITSPARRFDTSEAKAVTQYGTPTSSPIRTGHHVRGPTVARGHDYVCLAAPPAFLTWSDQSHTSGLSPVRPQADNRPPIAPVDNWQRRQRASYENTARESH